MTSAPFCGASGSRSGCGGSHHIFFRIGVAEIINLQPRGGGEAKPYQVRQVRDLVIKYRLIHDVDRQGEG